MRLNAYCAKRRDVSKNKNLLQSPSTLMDTAICNGGEGWKKVWGIRVSGE